MNYANVQTTDIVNGVGVRVTLFVSGCRRACKGCFNRVAWDFNYGMPFTFDCPGWAIIKRELSHDYVHGLTILGGEPMEPENIDTVRDIVAAVRHDFPTKSIWIYTGYTFEELSDHHDLLSMIDVLVDGAFVEELRDITLQFRGSSNQRIIDVPATLQSGAIVLWKE